MATWPVPTPIAEHSTHICVSAVLCVFLFSFASTGIARSATKFQRDSKMAETSAPELY
jgi:hypothetical protein